MTGYSELRGRESIDYEALIAQQREARVRVNRYYDEVDRSVREFHEAYGSQRNISLTGEPVSIRRMQMLWNVVRALPERPTDQQVEEFYVNLTETLDI